MDRQADRQGKESEREIEGGGGGEERERDEEKRGGGGAMADGETDRQEDRKNESVRISSAINTRIEIEAAIIKFGL